MPERRFPLLLLIETEYRYPLPPNPWGAEDWTGFREFARRPQAAFHILEPLRETTPTTQGFLEKTKRAWDELKQTCNARTRVVGIYLAAHGHVDESNEPYLIPGNAKADDRNTWVSLRQVLSVFHWNAQGQPAGPGTPKIILFLDGSKAPVPGEHGLSHRSFTTAVKKLVEGAHRDDLEVWLSADTSQRSLSGQEFGGSLFARCLLLGLAGAADEPEKLVGFASKKSPLVGHGDSSGRVDLGELRRFLQENIPRVAWNSRGLRQTPVFIGSHTVAAGDSSSEDSTSRPGAEVSLTRAESGTDWGEVWSVGLQSANKIQSDTIEGELESAWCDLEQLSQWAWKPEHGTSVPAVEPLKLARLRGSLLWADQALAGGRALQARAGALVTECRAELQRSHTEAAMGLTDIPSIEQGLKLAIGNHTPATTTETRQIVIDALYNLARAADAAWGAASQSTSVYNRRDPRAYLPILERLSELDGQRRIIEDLLLNSLNSYSSETEDDSRKATIAELVAQGYDLAAVYTKMSESRDRYAQNLAATETVLALGPYFTRWHDAWPADETSYTLIASTAGKFQKIWNEVWRLRSQLEECPSQSQIEVMQSKFDLIRSDLYGCGAGNETQSGLWQELCDLIKSCHRSEVAEDDVPTVWKRRECAVLQALLESGFPCDPTGCSATVGESNRSQLRKRWHELRRELATPTDWDDELPDAGETHNLLSELKREVQSPWGVRTDGVRTDDVRLTALLASHPWQPPNKDSSPDEAGLRSLRRADWERLRAISQREIRDFWPSTEGAAAGFQRLQPVWNLQTRLSDQMSDKRCVLTASPDTAIADDRKKLEKAEAVFARGLRFHCSEVQNVPQGFQQELVIHLDPGQPVWPFPESRMAVRFVTGDETVVSEATLVGPQDKAAPPPQTIALPDVGQTPQKAVIDYRGWRRKYALSTREVLSTVSHWRRSDAGERTVQVRLGNGPREDLLLVVDCSASMGFSLNREAAEGPATRFEAAQAALRSLLEGFQEDEGIRVGVWLIGHRVAWSRREPGKLLRQTEYAGGIPEDLLPAADVESILPLGRFDESALELVNRRLESVQPWGETPLYLALSRAVEEQSKGAQSSIRRIIAITDGVNYQFNPAAKSNIALPEVIRQAASANTEISVIGFALDPSDEKEYRQFIQQGWHYLPVRQAADLLPTLRKLITPQEFVVRDLESNWSERSPLGRPVQIPRESDRVISIAVGEQQVDLGPAKALTPLVTRTVLRGDEAIELVLDPGTNMATSEVAVDRNPEVYELVSQQPGHSPLELAVHLPRREGRRVEFQLSLRSPEGKVVECPPRLWIEVTPLAALGTSTDQVVVGLTEVFQDVMTVPRKPNPVFQVTCDSWPERGTAARIQFWMGDNPSVSWLVDPDGPPSQDPVHGMERIVWRESVSPERQPSLFVAPDHSDFQSIERIFVPDLSQVRHEFLVRKNPGQSTKLRISDSALWKSTARTLTKPVEIAVPRDAANLRPTTVRP